MKQRNDWENVFFLSPVNGGDYHGDKLPIYQSWPINPNSWLQRRLAELKQAELTEKGKK